MDIPHYIEETRNLFKTEFANLSFEELNWKRNSDSWSIGQCLDHIITIDQLYLKEFKKSIERKVQFSDRLLMPLAKVYLKSLLPYVSPVNAKPTKTFGIFQPSNSEISKSILKHFLSHLSAIELADRQLDSGQHHSKITLSPANRLIFIPCSKVPEVLSLHARRHIEQAVRVKQDPDFI